MLKLNKPNDGVNVQNLVPAYMFTRLLAAFFVMLMILVAVSFQLAVTMHFSKENYLTIANLEYSNQQTIAELEALKAEHNLLKANYIVAKTQYDNALIKEPTVKEAFSNHVVAPVKETAIQGYQKVKSVFNHG